MNKVIGDVIASMDNSTILFVFGDHGSTNDGNHGGATEEEVNAALFIYSHTRINNYHVNVLKLSCIYLLDFLQEYFPNRFSTNTKSTSGNSYSLWKYRWNNTRTLFEWRTRYHLP
jgi:hypothetical protein